MRLGGAFQREGAEDKTLSSQVRCLTGGWGSEDNLLHCVVGEKIGELKKGGWLRRALWVKRSLN